MNLDNIINEVISKFGKFIKTNKYTVRLRKAEYDNRYVVEYGDEHFYFDSEPTDKEIENKIEQYNKEQKEYYAAEVKKYEKQMINKWKQLEPGESDWKEFENLLKNHDWFSDYTEDRSVRKRGDDSKSEINRLYGWLKVWDLKRAEKLFKKYNKRG